MNAREVAQYWERNAPTWTRLVREGYDLYRDLLNTPEFFKFLPAVDGQQGLDVGCGEGHNTRLLAERGARMLGIDIAPSFVKAATEYPSACRFAVGSAQAIPCRDRSFDFATSFMCLMDVPDASLALREAFRVLRSGGFFQFSITHPCFNLPHRKLLRDAQGEAYAVEIGRYFETGLSKIEEWTFGAAPEPLRNSLPKFQIPVFHRTLADWISAIRDAGFQLESLQEPTVSEETAQRHPHVADTRVVAYFLHVRCRKP